MLKFIKSSFNFINIIMKKEELTTGLKSLCQIQQIDLELKDLQNQLSSIPSKISRWKDELENYKKEIAETKKEIEKLAIETKEKEIELNGNQETLKKYNAQLYIVKTNKEYSSLLHEIEELKRKNSHIEDNILEFMETIDSKEKDLKEKKKKLEELQEEFNKKEKEEREREKDLNEKLAQKKNEREKAVVNIDPSFLAKYERISKSKDRLAIVQLIGNCCGGCNVETPPQTRNEIKFGSKIITCEGCGRIMYSEEIIKKSESAN